MESLSRLASPGRLFLAGAALCAAQAGIASEKRSVMIGATVIATSQCRVDAASGARCSGSGASPRIIAATASPSLQASYEGQLVMRMSAVGASLDSRKTVAPSFERVVLTIAP